MAGAGSNTCRLRQRRRWRPYGGAAISSARASRLSVEESLDRGRVAAEEKELKASRAKPVGKRMPESFHRDNIALARSSLRRHSDSRATAEATVLVLGVLAGLLVAGGVVLLVVRRAQRKRLPAA